MVKDLKFSESVMSLQEFTEECAEELCECNVTISPPCDFCSGDENERIEKVYEEYLLNKGGAL